MTLLPDTPTELAAQARSLGQQSRAAEDRGDLAAALALNEAAAARFLQAGDAPGLLVATAARRSFCCAWRAWMRRAVNWRARWRWRCKWMRSTCGIPWGRS